MNAGLRALKNKSPKAFEKIMGKQAMYGMKTMSEGGVAQKSLYQTVKNENEMNRRKADLEARIEAARGTDAVKGLVEEYRSLTDTAAQGKKMSFSTYLKDKQAGYGAKVMGDGGVYADEGDKNDPPELTAKQLLDIIARQNPGQEVTGSSADVARSIADNMGYTTAVSSTAAPMKAIYMDRGSVEEDPQPAPVRPTDLSPMKPMKASLSSQYPEKEIMDSETPMPDQYDESFAGYVLAPYLRTGQVPTNIKVRNPQTGQFQDRQMEPEEIANYIYQNQVRQRVPSKMMSRDDAMEKALKIMRFRS